MLADPKKRTRYLLQPKGKPLYEDPNRFGTRMLEKMGWSKGKGLGANLGGAEDFIRVRYKQDQNGIGFDDKDTQWTQHESDFNSLLQSLTDDTGKPSSKTATADDNAKVHGLSGESLEKKSSNSRARVHYKKFTRGKDISQYNSKELANIFGKKTLETVEVPVEEPVIEKPKEDVSNLSGVITIESQLSVQEYFEAKMKAIRNRTAGVESPVDVRKEEYEPNNETVVQKKKKDRVDDQSAANPDKDDGIKTIAASIEEENADEDISRKKKKKKKKSKELEPPESSECIEDNKFFPEVEENTSRKKKKKSKELEPPKSSERIEDYKILPEVEEDTSRKKKKKSKELKPPKRSESIEDHKILPEVEDISRKKKAKKRKHELLQNQSIADECDLGVISVPDEDSSKNEDDVTDLTLSATKSKKKKKNKKEEEVQTISDEDQPHFFYNINSFAAEKFKYLDIGAFRGSNCGDIVGYGIPQQMKISVTEKANDGKNILEFWEKALSDKYGNDVLAGPSNAKKSKKKKYNANVLRKKNVFMSI